jgi:ankyrin repeat protein
MREAARTGHRDIVERMLQEGATDYDTAMILAAENGHPDIVELIRIWQATH